MERCSSWKGNGRKLSLAKSPEFYRGEVIEKSKDAIPSRKREILG
jgi:hypothetical protein